MNAIDMISRCMTYSENGGSGQGDLGLSNDTRADVDYLVSKLSERAIPEEPMGHGNQSIDAQVGET